jgi:hypothetical protein
LKNQPAKYYKRIVVFLDVLGFENTLKEFEEEALSQFDDDVEPKRISERANQFLDVFKDVIGLMDNYDCNFYLFSDNICITVDPSDDGSLAVDILFTVSTLFKKFSDMGYFLRGGIDFGWMLDEKDIALGIPLANAYKMENTLAIYPRVLVSKAYLDYMNSIHLNETDKFNFENFIKSSCELSYVNTFYNIVRNDAKIEFLATYSERISDKLEETKEGERIYMKFEWLKNEFNSFVESYLSEIEYFEQEIILTEEELDQIENIKIS